MGEEERGVTLPGLALVGVLCHQMIMMLEMIMMLSHSATLQEIIGKLTSKTIPVDQGRNLEHTRTCNADPKIVNKFNFLSNNYLYVCFT